MGGAHNLYTICGGKGGCGKTFLTANIALYFAKQGYKGAVCDADMKGPTLHTALGLGEKAIPIPFKAPGVQKGISIAPRPTLYDNLSYFSIENSSSGANESGRVSQIRHIHLENYDFTFLDVEAGMREEMAKLLFNGHRGLIVITPEPSCLERSYLLIRQAIYHRVRDMAVSTMDRSIVDEEFAKDDSGVMIRAVNRILARVKKIDPELAGQMTKALSTFSLGVFLNMARSSGDVEIGRMFCSTVSMFYGPSAVFLGHIPYDERVIMSERNSAPFIAEYGASETAACLEMAGRKMLEKTSNGANGHAQWIEVDDYDHYRLLNIPRSASPETIHSAYISTTAQYSEGSRATHGAIGPAERTKMVERINAAYATLSDKENKDSYDQQLSDLVTDDEQSVDQEAVEGEDRQADNKLPEFPGSGNYEPNKISGANLRDIRSSRGLSLEGIAADTKIRKAYLEALENESLENFPAPIFIRGFLKSYATALGLDPDEVLEKYPVDWSKIK